MKDDPGSTILNVGEVLGISMVVLCLIMFTIMLTLMGVRDEMVLLRRTIEDAGADQIRACSWEDRD